MEGRGLSRPSHLLLRGALARSMYPPRSSGRRHGQTGTAPQIGLAPVTRLSTYFLPTEKQAPADAEALSHKLLVRAGMVRQVGAGLWSWLPAGWRAHERVAQIVREEMNAVGAMEMLMPVLLPAEPWRRSGRYGIEE